MSYDTKLYEGPTVFSCYLIQLEILFVVFFPSTSGDPGQVLAVLEHPMDQGKVHSGGVN